MNRCRPSLLPPPYPRQRGAALVIALVILLVLTVMGVSGIRHATLEESMAFNTQAKSLTFQAAETAIGGVVINRGTVLNQALGAGTGGSIANDYTALVNPPGATPVVSATVTTTYVGWQNAPGYSLKDSANVQLNFNITGSGSMAAASATSVHLQGVARIGPKAGAVW